MKVLEENIPGPYSIEILCKDCKTRYVAEEEDIYYERMFLTRVGGVIPAKGGVRCPTCSRWENLLVKPYGPLPHYVKQRIRAHKTAKVTPVAAHTVTTVIFIMGFFIIGFICLLLIL